MSREGVTTIEVIVQNLYRSFLLVNHAYRYIVHTLLINKTNQINKLLLLLHFTHAHSLVVGLWLLGYFSHTTYCTFKINNLINEILKN